ncbi:hypothetical protein LCGC14_2911400, partial [marine sediment metagenome]
VTGVEGPLIPQAPHCESDQPILNGIELVSQRDNKFHKFIVKIAI